jgi:hypothetical protein
VKELRSIRHPAGHSPVSHRQTDPRERAAQARAVL